VPARPAACGGFEKLELAKAPSSLLRDRLFISPLDGAEDSARPKDIMEADPAAERETRLFLKNGENKFVIFSEELLARSGANFLRDVKDSDERLSGARFEERTLPSGLLAVLVVHDELEAPNEAVPVAHAYTALADDTVQVTHVFVNPAVVAAGSDGCQALALRVLSSLAPGSRKLDLAAGKRRLGDSFELDVPQGFSVTPQPGPDFDVFHVVAVRELKAQPATLGIYVGYHPSFEPEKNAKPRSSKILGKPVTWHEAEVDGLFRGDALVDLAGGPSLHFFFAAPSVTEARELARIAETVRSSR
jgi:hypothetical protein